MAGPWEDFLPPAETGESGPWSEFAPEPPKASGAFRRAADYGISGLKGIISVPEAAVGLADIPTGGYAGKAAEAIGFRPKEAKAFLDEYYSPEQKEAFQKVKEAKGFFGTLGEAVRRPSTIAHAVTESLPAMGAGGVFARGLTAAKAAAPWVAGAIGEGTVGAGMAAEQIRQQSPTGTITPGQAGTALASGAGTAAFGALGGKFAGSKLGQKLGIADVDTLLAEGLKKGLPADAVKRGIIGRVLGGAVSEGVLEELPQSMQEQIWQNIATGRPWSEGVPESGAMGLLAGGVMGGAGSGFFGGRARAEQPPPETPPVEPPIEPPAAAPPPVEPPADAGIDFTPTTPADLSAAETPAQMPPALGMEGIDYVPPGAAVHSDPITGQETVINPADGPLSAAAAISVNQQQRGMMPFAEDSAIRWADRLNSIGGRQHAVIPHPTVPGKFAVVPQELADLRASEQRDQEFLLAQQQVDRQKQEDLQSIHETETEARGKTPDQQVAAARIATDEEPTALALAFAKAKQKKGKANASLQPANPDALGTPPGGQGPGADIPGSGIVADVSPDAGAPALREAAGEPGQGNQSPLAVPAVGAETLGESNAAQTAETPLSAVPEKAQPGQPLQGEVAVAVAPADLDDAAKGAAADIPAIAKALQNRNRDSAASAAQMAKIVANPNPRLLMAAPTMSDGAPVVSDLHGVGKAVVGSEDVVVTGKREIPIRYAVVEAADLSASNLADGSRNMDYAVAPDKLVAINNGRTAAMIEAYRRGTAGSYRTAIEGAQTVHGVPAETIRAMKAPVLVRLMNPEDVTANIGDESNAAMALGLSATEQARNDASRFDAASVDYTEDGRPTDAALRGFIAAMPESERQTLAPNGQPTKQAHDRLLAAVFHAAYGDTDLVELMAQATDPEARNVLAGLSRAAASMAKLKDAGDLDIRSIVVGAAKRVINAVRAGVSFKKFLAQGDAYANSAEQAIAQFFATNSRSAKTMAERLADAADFAYAESQKSGADMFGEAIPRASRADVLRRVTDDTGRQENLEQPGRGQSYGRDAGHEADGREGQDDRGSPAPDRQGGFLASHTADDLRERQRRIAEAEREAARLQAELEAKEKADRERDDFALTGSDRPADNPNQGSLFTRARRYDTKTLDLFTSQLPAATGARPDPSTAATTERARLGAALAAYVRGRAGSLLGLAFTADWVAGKGSRLVGKTVASPADLATLAAVLRDPRVETFRYFLMKGNRIVHHEAVSSRMYDSTAAWTGGDAGENAFLSDIRSKMEHMGADGYYLMHNHPSTIMKPSGGDMRVTGRIDGQIPGFKGHIILDHGRFVLLERKGGGIESSVLDLPDIAGEDPTRKAVSHPVLGETISAPSVLASIADRVRDPSNVILVATDAQLKVVAVSSVPQEIIRKGGFGAVYAIGRLRKAAGSNAVFAVLPEGMLTRDVPRALYERGWFMDAAAVNVNGAPLTAAQQGAAAGNMLKKRDRPGLARGVEQPSKGYATSDLFADMSAIEREEIAKATQKNSPQMDMFAALEKVQEERSTTPVAESTSPREVGESPRGSGDGGVAPARDGAAPGKKNAPAPVSRELGSQAPEGAGMQERLAVRAEKSGSPTEPAQSGSGAESKANATDIPAAVQEAALIAAREEQDRINQFDLEEEIKSVTMSGNVDLSSIAENPEYWNAEDEEYTEAGNKEVDRLIEKKARDNLRLGTIDTLDDLNNAHQFAQVEAMEKILDGLGKGFERNYSWSSSRYIMVHQGEDLPDLKLRFANHLKTASGQPSPDVNVAPGGDSFMDAVNAVTEKVSPPSTAEGGKQEVVSKGNELLFSKQAGPRDLIIQHNLSAENLLHALKMGGIPVPSLAVTRKEHPMTSFGEITLIGSPEMVDPKGYAGTKVFGADIYSPRYPTISYRLDSAALAKINALLEGYRGEGRQIYGSEINRIDDLTSVDAFKKYAEAKIGENAPWSKLQSLAQSLLDEAGAKERIFQGHTYSGNRRYIDHTIENVVKILKKELRGGENFNYGVGSIRSAFTPQFRNIEQIRKAKDRLMDKAAFENVKKEIDDEFAAQWTSLASFHSYGDQMGFGDTVSQMMYDAAKMGVPRSLKENGFSEVPDYIQKNIAEFLSKLRTLPAEYFEAKILRDVDLAEFSGAVVPEGVDPKVIEALQSRGIKDIRSYRKGDEDDRRAKIGAFEHLMFSRSQDTKPSFSQQPLINPHTADTLRAALGKAINPKLIAGLEKSGKIKLASNWDAAAIEGMEASQADATGRPLAFFNPADGTSYFLYENIPATATSGELAGLLKHEIGVHALHLGRSDKEFQSILKSLDLMRRAGNKRVREAFKRAEKAGTTAGNVAEESLGYLIEAHPEATISQRFLAWLKQQINKVLGIARIHWQYSPADLNAMAQAALHRAEELRTDGREYKAQESEPQTDTKRGAGWLKIKLRQAQHKGELSAKAVEMVEWLVKQNPALVKYLAVAVENPKELMDGFNQPAYHGSPYRFSKFSLDHMGNGEGAQAYGWGLYMAGRREVAEYYRNALARGYSLERDGKKFDPAWGPTSNTDEHAMSMAAGRLRDALRYIDADTAKAVSAAATKSANESEHAARLYNDPAAVKREAAVVAYLRQFANEAEVGTLKAVRGQLYEVDIPEDGEYLLWDKPMSEQPEKVRAALDGIAKEYAADGWLMRDTGAESGARIYKALERGKGSDEAASKYLNSLGIAGIKYLDGTSRDKGEGSFNYVLFDAESVKVLQTFYDRPTGAAGNYNPFTQVMTLFRGNASDTTAIHEILHHLERMMPAEMQADIRTEWRKAATKEMLAAMKAKDQPRIDYFKAVLAGDQKKATELLTGKGMEGFNAVEPAPTFKATVSEIDTPAMRKDRQWRELDAAHQGEIFSDENSFLTWDSPDAVIKTFNSLKADVLRDGMRGKAMFADLFAEEAEKSPEQVMADAVDSANRHYSDAMREKWVRDWVREVLEKREIAGKDRVAAAEKYAADHPPTHDDLAIGQDYQYLNPSEFWAVRMTSTMAARFEAKSIWARSLQWLKEALEHIKGALGLASDHPLLKAFDDLIARGKGEFKSKEMLGSSEVYATPDDLANAATMLSRGAGRGMPLFSRSQIIGDSGRQYTPEQAGKVASAILQGAKDFTDRAIDSLIYNFQDRFMDLRRIQEAGGAVPESMDASLAEKRYSGIVRAKTDDFNDDELNPLLKEIHDSKLEYEAVEEYLHAKTAPSRNAAMKAINPTESELDQTKADLTDTRDTLAIEDVVQEYVAKRREIRRVEADVEDGIADDSLVGMLKQELAALKRDQMVKDYTDAVDRLKAMQSAKPYTGDNTALSGMSNQKASEVVAKAKKDGTYEAFERVSKRVDAITSGTRRVFVENGLETQSTIDAWEAAYDHYVPLHIDEVQNGMPAVGQGFNIRGKESKRATGSEKERTNILAHVVAQREAAIVRAEKVKVDRALYEFAQAHPDESLWTLDEADMVRDVDKVTGLVTNRVNPLYKQKPNVLVFKIDGEEHTITFNEKNPSAMRVAVSLKNLSAVDLGEVTLAVGKFTRLLATMNTSANPVFVARNFMKDIQTAFVNLSDTEIADKKRAVFANVPKAIKGFWDMSHGKMDSEYAKYAREFRDAGGQTGWLDHYKDIGSRAKNLKGMLDRMKDGKVNFTMRQASAWWRLVEDGNMAVENGVRLSAYVEARKAGMTEAKAALLAKELTVNFNTHGARGVELNMWYMFMNASIQGTARIFKAVGNKNVQKILGFVVMSGFALSLLARAMAGDDDDDGENDYDQLPEYVKDRNFVFWVNGKPITIPMPYGYNFFSTLGRKAGDAMFRKNFSPIRAAADVLSSAFDAFSPTGQSGSLLQLAAPTIADPFIQWSENKNFAGNPMRKEQNPFGPPKPEYQMGFKSTSAPAKWLAELLNTASGGNSIRPGSANINPAAFDFAVSSVFGGAGRTYLQLASLPIKASAGDEIQAREIPFVNIFASANPENQAERKFFEGIRSVQTAANEYKAHPEMSAELEKERGAERRLLGMAKLSSTQLEHLKKRQQALEKHKPDGWRDQVAVITKRRAEIMNRFNKRYAEVSH